MELRKCLTCQQELSEDRFYSSEVDECLSCMRSKARAELPKIKAEAAKIEAAKDVEESRRYRKGKKKKELGELDRRFEVITTGRKKCRVCHQWCLTEEFSTDYATTCNSCRQGKLVTATSREINTTLLLKKLNEHKVKQHAVVDGVELKCCSTCVEWLPLEHFYKATGRHDGLMNVCKKCSNAAVKLLRARKRAKLLGINVDF